jgi:hypothetical protein
MATFLVNDRDDFAAERRVVVPASRGMGLSQK